MWVGGGWKGPCALRAAVPTASTSIHAKRARPRVAQARARTKGHAVAPDSRSWMRPCKQTQKGVQRYKHSLVVDLAGAPLSLTRSAKRALLKRIFDVSPRHLPPRTVPRKLLAARPLAAPQPHALEPPASGSWGKTSGIHPVLCS